jgi:protein SCO1/2
VASSSHGWRAAAVVALAATFGLVRSAAAQPPPADFTAAPPPEVAAVTVDEHLGAQVPLDLAFRDQDGHEVTLGQLVKGDLPVVLTLNYSSCPMLCSLQLNGLVDSLGELDLTAGKQFRIVTVVLEPKETPARAAETRTAYLDKLESKKKELRPSAALGGWTFLVSPDGSDAAIRRLADIVGVRYRYVPEQAEWAHPAVLVFLSPSGTVTRYVHGIQYDSKELFSSIVRAGTSEPSATVGFVQRCFNWSPAHSTGPKWGTTVLRWTAAGFAAVLATALLLAHFLRRQRGASGVARS